MSANTVLPFAGGELSSFDPLDSSCIEKSDQTVMYNTAHARCAIAVGSQVTGFLSPTWTAASDFWFHVVFYHNGGTEFFGETPLYKFYDGATEVFRLTTHVSGGGVVVTAYTLQSAVLTSNGSFSMSVGLETIDINVVAGASGSCDVYVAGTNRLSVSGLNHTGFSGVTQIFGGPTSVIAGNPPGHSEIICDIIPHVGDALITLAETNASAVNTDWFGSVSAINEIILNDSTSVTSDAANQISTYYKSGASLGTYNVVGVFVGVRAQLTAGSSTNLQVCLRTNGTNYFSPTIALDFGFQACCASWTVNPFTGSAWDPSTAAAIESGMKSIA